MYFISDHQLAALVSDLPAPSLFGVRDKYSRFELSLPFARIKINQFMVLLNLAKADCGDADDFVTLTSLRTHFKTPAWKDLEDESSALSRFLLSAAFKRDGLPGEQICCSALRIYAILNCQGLVSDRAEWLYEEL